MNKKKFRDQNNKVVSSRNRKKHKENVAMPASPYIVLKCLADIYGLDKSKLTFAIAETANDEGGFEATPVVKIQDSDQYIDLIHGMKLQNAHARNAKQNFFAAIVKFDDGDFVFTAPRIEAKVNKKTLVAHYGTAIIG